MKENSLEKAFTFVKTFYKELAQMLSDLNELMAKAGWDPVGSNIYSDTSRAIDNPNDWLPHYIYKNYIDEDVKDSIRGILVLFDIDDFPQSIVFGKAEVSVKSDYQWDLWDLWFENKHKFKKLDGRIVDVSSTSNNSPINGQLFSIPLSDIGSKTDIKNKIVEKMKSL